MCFFFSFVPATAWLVVGYFVLFAAAKTDGGMRKFGRILAIWVFVIAASFPVMGAYVTSADICPIETMGERYGRAEQPGSGDQAFFGTRPYERYP